MAGQETDVLAFNSTGKKRKKKSGYSSEKEMFAMHV